MINKFRSTHFSTAQLWPSFSLKEHLMADLPELEEIEENLKHAEEDETADVEGH